MRYATIKTGDKVHIIARIIDGKHYSYCNRPAKGEAEEDWKEVKELPTNEQLVCRVCAGNLYTEQRRKLKIRKGYRTRGLE